MTGKQTNEVRLSCSLSDATASRPISSPPSTEDPISFEKLSLHEEPGDPPTMDSPANGEAFPQGDTSGNDAFLSLALPLATGADSTVDKLLNRKNKRPVTAIFIHAGAGYHSIQNEQFHLKACSKAARVAMRLLTAGNTAVEAVEAAVRFLEDREITNAGFGSNLTVDGTVECDATIVDHLGRSGACGAVPGIKNPVSLAKLILDGNSKPMSLRRVPPNVLVGDGAKDFALDHGMAVFENRFLVSKNAKDRFREWNEALYKSEQGDQTGKRHGSLGARSLTPEDTSEKMEQDLPLMSSQLGDHKIAILTGTWNEGQADSPSHSSPGDIGQDQIALGRSYSAALSGQDSHSEAGPSLTPFGLFGPVQPKSPNPANKRPRISSPEGDETVQFVSSTSSTIQAVPLLRANHDRPASSLKADSSFSDTPQGIKRTLESMDADFNYSNPKENDRDYITDTVGAIAIDSSGNIAAASSSGGIGMKHRGRMGPAALVGVGSAIIPVDPDDEEGVSVAVVTSGTGEHMVPTMASYKCAERLHQNTRRGPRGMDVQEADEEAIMNSFIIDDFMCHPGVKNQPTLAAIGVMAVKKTNRGYYLYFSHNTDSFALASMSSKDREPLCVMSRTGELKDIPTHGARKIRVD